MKTQKLITHCSDWHLSWGLGTNHIGELELDKVNNRFIWTGHQQGRHGQIWNPDQKICFTVNGETLQESVVTVTYRKQDYDSLPKHSEVMQAVQRLMEMQ